MPAAADLDEEVLPLLVLLTDGQSEFVCDAASTGGSDVPEMRCPGALADDVVRLTRGRLPPPPMPVFILCRGNHICGCCPAPMLAASTPFVQPSSEQLLLSFPDPAAFGCAFVDDEAARPCWQPPALLDLTAPDDEDDVAADSAVVLPLVDDIGAELEF